MTCLDMTLHGLYYLRNDLEAAFSDMVEHVSTIKMFRSSVLSQSMLFFSKADSSHLKTTSCIAYENVFFSKFNENDETLK